MTTVDIEVWSLETVMPSQRIHDLVMTESGDELLVYDLRTHHIHHLNSVTAEVWRRCDGQTSYKRVASELAVMRRMPIDADVVALAVTKLADAGLLTGPPPVTRPTSRRDMLRRAAGFGLAAIPAIVSTSAPMASASASSPCKMHPSTGEPIESPLCGGRTKDWCCIRINATVNDRDGVCKEFPRDDGRVDYECVPR